MASGVYNDAKAKMWSANSNAIDLIADIIKAALLSNAVVYTFSPDTVFADEGGANDVTDAELNVTGYTRGFGGAGRKTLSGKSLTVNNTNDRAEFTATNLTWTTLGTGQTIVAVILMKEVTNDAATRLVANIEFTATPTNGGDFTLQWNSAGIIQLS